MPDDRGPPQRIVWQEIFPWLILFRTVGWALSLRKMLLGAAALTLTALGWHFLAFAFFGAAGSPQSDSELLSTGADDGSSGVRRDRQLPEGIESYQQLPWQASLSPPEQWLEVSGTGHGWTMAEPFVAPWKKLSDPFRRIFDPELTWTGLAFYLLCALWVLAVWALFGGMISRMTAFELARDEKLTLGAAFAHIRAKWTAYFTAPLLPLVGVLIGVAMLTPLGLLLRLDLGSIVVGLLWGLVLVAGLVFSIFVVGLVFGWPLMWGALSAEGMDNWDALSRAYSYVYQRPLHYLFYAIVSGVLGTLGWLVVSLFATLVIYLGAWGVSWSSGGERIGELQYAAPLVIASDDWPTAKAAGESPTEPGRMLKTGARIIALWTVGVKLLTLGFGYSFFWTAATAIYFLLRRDTDATPLDDIQRDDPVEPPAAAISADASDAAPAANSTPPTTAGDATNAAPSRTSAAVGSSDASAD